LANQDLNALHEKAEALRRANGGGAPSEANGEDDPPIALDGLPTPEAAEAAHKAHVQAMTAERKAELNELASSMFPDMVQTMRDALRNGTDASLDVAEREAALLDLADLVEDIDHARDLKSIGGFPEVIALLASETPPLQAAAAWIIGSSVKNHRELQLHLLEERALPSLLALVRSHADGEVRGKALYAVSALTRNCKEAQSAFGAADGVGALLGVLAEGEGAPHGSRRLVRKALSLVSDLLREQRQQASELKVTVVTDAAGGEGGGDVRPTGVGALELWRNASELCGAVVDCFKMREDLDAQEKALQALEQLMDSGLLAAGCDLPELQKQVREYRERCDRAIAKAESSGQEDEEEQDGVGNCAELAATAKSLDKTLATLV